MSQALRVLKENGKVMDIGQITPDKRKEIQKMIRKGIVKMKKLKENDVVVFQRGDKRKYIRTGDIGVVISQGVMWLFFTLLIIVFLLLSCFRAAIIVALIWQFIANYLNWRNNG